MTRNERPLDGGDEQIAQTGNGPEDPMESVILRELFGEPNEAGVYAPNDDEEE